jgi:hypothetical protein
MVVERAELREEVFSLGVLRFVVEIGIAERLSLPKTSFVRILAHEELPR